MSVIQTISAKKLHPALGAEIRGIDLGRPVDAASFKAVNDAWMEHLVLVFPEQHISDEQHVAFTRYFGVPEIFHQDIIRSKRMKEIFRLANVDEDNNLMPAKHITLRQTGLAQMWHTDSSYRPLPCVGSLLHGLEISRTGGQTRFTNMYRVYEALPESLKKKVRGRKARHDFGNLHRLADIKPLTEAEKAAMPPVWQPMVRSHPVTGRISLYISPIYNDQVEGMDDAAAVTLIAELTEFAQQPGFVYSHQWEPNDIVMWDNRCTMHQVTPHDPMERRVMHRTTIEGVDPVTAA